MARKLVPGANLPIHDFILLSILQGSLRLGFPVTGRVRVVLHVHRYRLFLFCPLRINLVCPNYTILLLVFTIGMVVGETHNLSHRSVCNQTSTILIWNAKLRILANGKLKHSP